MPVHLFLFLSFFFVFFADENVYFNYMKRDVLFYYSILHESCNQQLFV